MPFDLTEQTDRDDLRDYVAGKFRGLCKTLAIKYTTIADRLGFTTSSMVERWAKERSNNPLPFWALYDRDAIPDPLFEALVRDARETRERTAPGLVRPAGRVVSGLLTDLCEGSSALGKILEDGVEPHEVPEVERVADIVIARAEDAKRACAAIKRAQPKSPRVHGGDA